jgi:hypothetical protein
VSQGQDDHSYLGERLAEEDLVTLLDKVSDGEGILEDVT